MSSIQDRQKLIRIADRSDFGWDVVQEYQADELAADSDDEKKLSKAEKAAEQKSQKRKRRAASGKKTGFGPQAQSPRSEWWKDHQWPCLLFHSFHLCNGMEEGRSLLPVPYRDQDESWGHVLHAMSLVI